MTFEVNMNLNVALLFSTILFVGCQRNHSEMAKIHQQKVDSLSGVISKLDSELRNFKESNPFVLKVNHETSTGTIALYQPIGLTIDLRSTRPNFNGSTFMCVPAAFTSPSTTIEGVFIREGEMINETKNEEINGFVMFSKEEWVMNELKHLTNEMIQTAVAEKKSLFQEVLLLKNSEIVKCELFGSYKNTRRALVKSGIDIFIAESEEPLTILEFQEALVEINIDEALYLDMGTWSEGWYKNVDCDQIVLGEFFTNTHKQTNWIVFEKRE